MCALPTGKQTGGDFEAIPEGTYEVELKRASLSTEKEYQTDSFNDGEGLKYQAINLTWDVDGEEWTERFVKVSLHENSKLFNRFSALLGRKITDADKVEWGIAAEAKKNLPIDKYYKAKDDEDGVKKGDWVQTGYDYDGIEGAVESITINGEELIGKRCFLTLDVNKAGYNRAAAGAASPLPKRGVTRARPAEAGEPEGEDGAPAEETPRGRGRQAEAAPQPARGRRQPPAGAPQ